jgi:hypothetical protein
MLCTVAVLAFFADLRTSPDPYIALMLGGFAVGVFGYLYGSRFIVGIGVAMIFMATLLIPLALNVSN